MASTYSNSGIELIGTGEQSGTWGTTTNTNLQIVDRLANGVGAISLSGTTHTLTTSNGTLSDGQYRVLVFGGSPSGTNTVTISPNSASHVYFVKNGSGQSVVLTQGSGGNVTVANGKSAIVYCDGAGSGAAVVDITSTFVPPGALLAANNLSDVASASTARTNLGLAIGTNVQAYDAQLTDLAGLTPAIADGIVGDGSNFIATSSSTDALRMPSGTTAERPGTPANGMIRYNSDDAQFEGYADGAWGAIAGGGGEAGGAIIVNTTTASESYTFPSGTNGFSVGPITVSNGVTVTVASGQRWVVI